MELCKRALEISPDKARYIGTHAFALYGTGEYADAIKRFRLSTRLNKGLSATNTLMIAMSQAKLNQMDAAKESYDEAIRLSKLIPTEPGLFEQNRQEAELLIYE